MHSTAIRHGIIAAAIMILIILIPVYLFKDGYDMNIGEIIGYSTMIAAMCMVFFGIKRYRDKELGGMITFGQAFGIGTYIAVIGAFIFAIFTGIFYEITTFGEDYKAFYVEEIRKSGEPPEVIQQKLSEFQQYYEMWDSSFLQGIVMFGTVFVIGVIIALISAAILKTKKPAAA